MHISYTNELHEKYKPRTIASAEVVLPIVFDLIHPKSVVDIGCGHGIWLKFCQQLGTTDLLGVDGAYIDPDRLLIPRDCFQAMDLNQPEPIARRFDLAMSLEVAEHLHPESTGRFLGLLTSLSDFILFSAAIPGQPGDAHINARWHSFWIGELEKLGFVALDFVRPKIWHDERIMLCYRQNLLLFVKKAVYLSNADVQNLPRANCLQLIDEDSLLSLLGFRKSLRRCGRILWNRLFRGRIV